MNTNYLKGMKCPDCTSEGPFSVQYSTWVLTYDDGIKNNHDLDYTDDSSCICPNCDYEGPIHTFKAPVP